jgi:hypothetical protein
MELELKDDYNFSLQCSTNDSRCTVTAIDTLDAAFVNKLSYSLDIRIDMIG